MSPLHYKAIQRLAYCTFLPGSWDKRFARDMATLGPYDLLTPKQEVQVERMAYRYRRQTKWTPPQEWRHSKPTPESVRKFWLP